jgi:hypothetical protein
MFIDFLNVWMNANNVHPDTMNNRYITFPGDNCTIRIWYYGKVEIDRNKRFLISFKFNEKKIKKFMKKVEETTEV